MKPREYTLESGIKILLGRDENNNDELVKQFQGEENFILHTVAPGSPFCVMDEISEKIGKKEIKQAAVICAAKSQDWRDNKKSVRVHLFTGKDVHKPKNAKAGSWTLKNKPKVIKAKKREIRQWLSDKSN